MSDTPVLTVDGATVEALKASVNTTLLRIRSLLESRERTVYVQVDAVPTAGEPFGLEHSLGVPPKGFTYDAHSSGVIVWADAEDRKLWTSSRIVVRANIARARLVLHVKG